MGWMDCGRPTVADQGTCHWVRSRPQQASVLHLRSVIASDFPCKLETQQVPCLRCAFKARYQTETRHIAWTSLMFPGQVFQDASKPFLSSGMGFQSLHQFWHRLP